MTFNNLFHSSIVSLRNLEVSSPLARLLPISKNLGSALVIPGLITTFSAYLSRHLIVNITSDSLTHLSVFLSLQNLAPPQQKSCFSTFKLSKNTFFFHLNSLADTIQPLPDQSTAKRCPPRSWNLLSTIWDPFCLGVTLIRNSMKLVIPLHWL